MRKICVINYKGGTGKTSTSVNLAHGLALRGFRVLLVDSDPQGSAGYHLGVTARYTLYDLIMGKRPLEGCVVRARKNLDMICSNERLFPAEIALAGVDKKELVLSRRLARLKRYDYVIFDCAPAMNLVNQNILLYCDDLIVPVSMEYLSLMGVKQLLNNIKIVNKIFAKRFDRTIVVPTFFDKRSKKSSDVLKSLKRVFPKSIVSPVRTCAALSEAPSVKRTVFEFDPHSTGAEDYYKVIEEVLSDG